MQARYTILGEIASGATATVYLAEDGLLRRKIALKKLHPHLLNHSETVRRFEKEAVAVASLSHENIIKVYDFGTQDRGLFLAMEYVDGDSMEHFLKRPSGILPNLAALSLFHQLFSGLAAAHAAGIIHRDIKPSNVLVDSKGRIRIADFGIAFLSEGTSITRTGSYLGTPGYSAPEQAQGLPTTDKTDIFAAGIMCYRCLTGRLPFEGETPHAVLIAIMERDPIKAGMLNRRLLPGLAELVEAMLAKDSAGRPSAARCCEILEGLASANGVQMGPERIRLFVADAEGCTQSESHELSAAFARKARVAEMDGRQREAMKHFSLAEIFAEPSSDIGREAIDFLERSTRSLRRRRWAAWVLALLAVATAGFLLRRPLDQAVFTLGRRERAASKTEEVEVPSGKTVPSETFPAPLAERPLKAVSPGADAATPLSRRTTLPADTKGPVQEAIELPDRKRVHRKVSPRTLPAPSRLPAGYVTIRTSPPFAKAAIDGNPAGSTPIKAPVRVAAGHHRLDLEKDGCKPIRTEFRIEPDETLSLRYTLDRAEPAVP